MTIEEMAKIKELFSKGKNTLYISEELGLTLAEVNDYMVGRLRPENRDGQKHKMQREGKPYIAKV